MNDLYRPYADNKANNFLGYVRAQQEAMTTAEAGSTPVEVLFAWRVDLIVHRAEQALQALENKTLARIRAINPKETT